MRAVLIILGIFWGIVTPLALIVIAISVVIIASPAPDSSEPDWTIAPCSWWADNAQPKLPAYTITDECVADNGTVSIAPDTQFPTR